MMLTHSPKRFGKMSFLMSSFRYLRFQDSHPRFYSSKGIAVRGKPVAMNIVDPWLPPAFPSPMKLEWERVVHKARSIYTLFKLSKRLPGWNKTATTQKIQDSYVQMNEAFASGDRQKLSLIVSDGMLAKLKADMKETQRLGRYVWRSFGSVAQPKIVNAVIAQVMYSENDTHDVVQLTVRVQTKQAVGIYKGEELIAGNLNQPKEVTEFIVVERDISDSFSDWKIAGKLEP